MILKNVSDRAVTLKDSSNVIYSVPAYGDLVVDDAKFSDQTFRQTLRNRIRDVVVVPGSLPVSAGFALVFGRLS